MRADKEDLGAPITIISIVHIFLLDTSQFPVFPIVELFEDEPWDNMYTTTSRPRKQENQKQTREE